VQHCYLKKAVKLSFIVKRLT